jgi:hypothetical protein
LAERWPLPTGAASWLPLRADGAVNSGIAQPDPSLPISGTQASNILRRPCPPLACRTPSSTTSATCATHYPTRVGILTSSRNDCDTE